MHTYTKKKLSYRWKTARLSCENQMAGLTF